jgi:hypothetical protein
MLDAAQTFLHALSPDQRAKATYALTDKERENWNFVPMARSGLPLKAMDEHQRELATGLLRTGLSHAGLARAETVRSLDLVLKEMEHGAARRDPLMYYVTIFGDPATDKSWGWRFEGHHLSFNFTVIDGAHVFFTPSFIGSNPAEVRSGPQQGTRVLGPEDDLGRELLKSLEPAQRQVAIISATAPHELVTSNRPHIDPLAPAGIMAAQLTAPQREKLMALIRLYFDRVRPELAEAMFAKVSAAGANRIGFAWAGGLDRGQGNYYRIQGPTFLIEFDNTQNDANHIHTVVRDFTDDFGGDPLAEHYARDHAK